MGACTNLCVCSVWPDWAIYWTLGKFLKPLATINLPKSPTFLGNFCKRVKIYHFSSEIIFGQLLQIFGDFYLVTLLVLNIHSMACGWIDPSKSVVQTLTGLFVNLPMSISGHVLHLFVCLSISKLVKFFSGLQLQLWLDKTCFQLQRFDFVDPWQTCKIEHSVKSKIELDKIVEKGIQNFHIIVKYQFF